MALGALLSLLIFKQSVLYHCVSEGRTMRIFHQSLRFKIMRVAFLIVTACSIQALAAQQAESSEPAVSEAPVLSSQQSEGKSLAIDFTERRHEAAIGLSFYEQSLGAYISMDLNFVRNANWGFGVNQHFAGRASLSSGQAVGNGNSIAPKFNFYWGFGLGFSMTGKSQLWRMWMGIEPFLFFYRADFIAPTDTARLGGYDFGVSMRLKYSLYMNYRTGIQLNIAMGAKLARLDEKTKSNLPKPGKYFYFEPLDLYFDVGLGMSFRLGFKE